MAAFNSTVRALLDDREVSLVQLIHFEFLTTPKRIHLGRGSVTAGGFTWQGIGEAGSIDGLEAAIGGGTPKATFALSGVSNDNLAAFLGQRTEVYGRRVTVYVQFYDPATQAPLDTIWPIYTGIMNAMALSRGPYTSTCYVTADSPFTRRDRTPNGTISDRDQKRLYPTGGLSGGPDRIFEMVAQMAGKKFYWPLIVG